MTEALDNSPSGVSAESQPAAQGLCKIMNDNSGFAMSKTNSHDSANASISSLDTLVLTPPQVSSGLPSTPTSQEVAELDATHFAKTKDEVDKKEAKSILPAIPDGVDGNTQVLKDQSTLEADSTVKVTRGSNMVSVFYKSKKIPPYFQFLNTDVVIDDAIPIEIPGCPGQWIKVEFYEFDDSNPDVKRKGFMPEPSSEVPIISAMDSSKDRLLYSQVWPVGKDATFPVKLVQMPAEEESSADEGISSPRPHGLTSSPETDCKSPTAAPLIESGTVAAPVGDIIKQRMDIQPSGFDLAPVAQVAPVSMQVRYSFRTDMQFSGTLNGAMYAPLGDYGPNSGMPHIGYPMPPPNPQSAQGWQQPQLTLPLVHARQDRLIDEGHLPVHLRPKHEGKGGSSFIRAAGQHVVFLEDGTYIDLKNVLLATEIQLSEALLDSLEKDFSQLQCPVYSRSDCKPAERPMGKIRFRTFMAFRETNQAAYAIHYLRTRGGISGTPFIRVEYHKPGKLLKERNFTN
ncbi:hypothetical protein NCC49_001553 [Naganishia albida]|nr:hypothetical protein NCC49_001553 [Naganishia albida]